MTATGSADRTRTVGAFVGTERPEGIGTARSEGLLSWVPRSAWRHQVPPGDFVLDVVAPALGRPRIRGAGDIDWGPYFARILSSPPASLQGRDRYAATWVEALEAASGRTDLRFLTLLPWREVLPIRGLLRPELRHCPRCYSEAHQDRRVVFEPLLWSIAPVTVCDVHDVRLEERCPGCGATRPVLTFWSMPGHCPRCGRWLGREDGGAAPEPEELEWGCFVSAQVGDLLARAPELERRVEPQGPVRLVHHAAANLAGGSWTGLARLLHMTDGTVWMWQAGRVQPSLEALLRLCCLTGATLVEALTGAPLDARRIPPVTPWLPPQSERHEKVDLRAVQDELALAAAAEAPETLDSLSFRLRMKESRLCRLYPEECRRIVERGAAAREARSGQLAEDRDRAIDDCVEQHARAGVPATRRMVEAEVGFQLWSGPHLDRWREARARVGMPV